MAHGGQGVLGWVYGYRWEFRGILESASPDYPEIGRRPGQTTRSGAPAPATRVSGRQPRPLIIISLCAKIRLCYNPNRAGCSS